MSGFIGNGGGSLGRSARFIYTATEGRTVFSGPDDRGLTLKNAGAEWTEVVVNGMWLPPTDYTVDNASQVTLGAACSAGDQVYVFCLSAFNPVDGLSLTQNGADIVDKPAFLRNLGGIDVSATVAITTTTTLTSSAFGKLHLISGASAYAVTLPTPVGNTGAVIALSVDGAANASKTYTIASPSGKVGRNTSLVMWAHEQLVVRSDGTNWVIVGARQIPLVGTLTRITAQSSSTATNIAFTAASGDPTGLNLAYDAANSNFKAPRVGVYKFDAYVYQTQSGGSYSQVMVGANSFSYTGSLTAGTVYGSKSLSLSAGDSVNAQSRMDGSSPTIAANVISSYLSYSEIVPSW